MADTVLVRFPDELAKAIRQRSQSEGKTMTAFINEAVRERLARLAETEELEDDRKKRLRFVASRIADLRDAISDQAALEASSEPAVRAFQAIADCVELLVNADQEADLHPLKWQHFMYSAINKSGSEEEARRMFAKDYAQIAARHWSWYLDNSRSEEKAKDEWLRQRRRLGFPIEPDKGQ